MLGHIGDNLILGGNGIAGIEAASGIQRRLGNSLISRHQYLLRPCLAGRQASSFALRPFHLYTSIAISGQTTAHKAQPLQSSFKKDTGCTPFWFKALSDINCFLGQASTQSMQPLHLSRAFFMLAAIPLTSRPYFSSSWARLPCSINSHGRPKRSNGRLTNSCTALPK